MYTILGDLFPCSLLFRTSVFLLFLLFCLPTTPKAQICIILGSHFHGNLLSHFIFLPSTHPRAPTIRLESNHPSSSSSSSLLVFPPHPRLKDPGNLLSHFIFLPSTHPRVPTIRLKSNHPSSSSSSSLLVVPPHPRLKDPGYNKTRLNLVLYLDSHVQQCMTDTTYPDTVKPLYSGRLWATNLWL